MATEKPYFPIHVGKALSDIELRGGEKKNLAADDTGDNISVKTAVTANSRECIGRGRT